MHDNLKKSCHRTRGERVGFLVEHFEGNKTKVGKLFEVEPSLYFKYEQTPAQAAEVLPPPPPHPPRQDCHSSRLAGGSFSEAPRNGGSGPAMFSGFPIRRFLLESNRHQPWCRGSPCSQLCPHGEGAFLDSKESSLCVGKSSLNLCPMWGPCDKEAQQLRATGCETSRAPLSIFLARPSVSWMSLAAHSGCPNTLGCGSLRSAEA